MCPGRVVSLEDAGPAPDVKVERGAAIARHKSTKSS